MTEIDFPDILSRIVAVIGPTPAQMGPAHSIILTDDADSLKSAVSHLLKTEFEGRVVLFVTEHPGQTATSAYRGIKLSLAAFFNSIHSSRKPEDGLHFLRELRSELGSAFPLFASFVPEVTGEGRADYGSVVKSLLYIESELFPVVRNFFTFVSKYFQARVCIFVNEFHNVDGPSLSLFAYLLHELPSETWMLAAAGKDSQSSIENLGFLTRGGSVEIFVGCIPSTATHRTVDNPVNGSQTEAATSIPEKRWLELSEQCRELLTIIACCDGFDVNICSACFDNDTERVQSLLEEAHEKGFVVLNIKSGVITDVTISRDISDLAVPDQKQRAHYRIAHALYRQPGYASSPENSLFLVRHFNESLEYVRRNQEHELCGRLNLLAGIRLQDEGRLADARAMFNVSAELLRECAWSKVEEPLYQVLLALARLEYQLGEYDQAEHQVDYLLERVKDPVKRGVLYELKVVINNRLGRYRRAVLILKEGLMELGLNMPWEDAALDQEVIALTRGLSSSDGDTTPGKISGDPSVNQAILKLLFVGGMSLHHTSAGLMTWGALQIIHHAGVGTASPVKAIGFVVFGRVQIMHNEIDLGHEYGLKALELNRKMDDIALRCRVYGIFAFFILPWKRPFAESFDLLREAEEAGETSGDLIGAYVVKTHRLNVLLLSGKPLSDILKVNVDDSNPSRELTYYITHYQKNLVRFLMNESSLFSIPHLEPSWLAATNTIQEEKFYRNFVWSRYYFMFGYYDLAEDAAAEANENRKLQEAAPLIPMNYLIWCLSISQNWTNIAPDQRNRKFAFLKEVVGRFEIWASHSPSNFRPCYLMLAAEILRLEGNVEAAALMFEEAGNVSADNLWYKALATELLSKLYFSEGRYREGTTAMNACISWYTQWGAPAKVVQLYQQYSPCVGSPANIAREMNIELIQHELSGYLHVRPLVKKLLVLCLRISGSSSAVLACRDGNVETELMDTHTLGPRDVFPLEDPFVRQKLDEAMRLRNAVNGTAVHPRLHDEDTPDNLRKSFLVVPVYLRDHLSFALYLESVFDERAYPQDVIRWIRIALNQGAIAIENARIHELSLKLNDEIRQKMEEKERLMNELKVQRDLHLKAVERTQNEDRKRIASHLHDSVGSMLSGIKMRLDSFQADFDRYVPERAGKFSATIGLIDETVQELRRIVYDMLPVSLHRFGLQPTLHTFVDQINESRKVQIELQLLGLEERLNEELEMAVYRICQELVQNVLKHAAATTVRLQIIRHIDRVNVIVEDNGKGMDAAAIVPGIGFDTITTKVNLFRGTFDIESAPGKGTMILIDIPVTG